MRYSKQRETILKLVKSTHCHPTAEWVFDEARNVMPNISLGTVYRNLNQLEEMNELRIMKEGTVVRYDGNMDRHDHFQCSECNKLYDVDFLSNDLIKQIQTQSNFNVNNVSLMIEGVCKNH